MIRVPNSTVHPTEAMPCCCRHARRAAAVNLDTPGVASAICAQNQASVLATGGPSSDDEDIQERRAYISERRKELAARQAKLDALRLDHAAAVDANATRHSDELQRSQAEHDAVLGALATGHDDELQRLRAEMEGLLEELDAHHGDKLQRLQAEHTAVTGAFVARHGGLPVRLLAGSAAHAPLGCADVRGHRI